MRIRILGLLVLATSPLCAEVEIRVAGDRVSLLAVSAPVSEILDSLARQTGIRLIYDAPRPRQALTATLENRTPAEAILSVLEGLGLNYALVMDRGGARVEQLLILGTVGATAPPVRPTPPAASPPQPLSPTEEEAIWADEADADELTDETDELGVQEAGELPPPGAAPRAGPPPPDYPNSAFSPRLPLPTPPPAPSPPPNPDPKDQ